MSYPAISLATATVGRYRCPQKRLQTARQPPVYPNSSPRIIAPVTPSPPSAALTPSIPVHRWIRVKEDQLDQQRKFILERLETAREKLDDLRARESMASEKRGLTENLVQWAGKFGKGLDDLPDEKRRDVLRLLVDQVLVDRNNNISITLGIPTEDFASIENEESRYSL